MKICRFDDGRIGLVQGDTVRDVTAVLETLGKFGYPLPKHDPFIAQLGALRAKIEEAAARARSVPLDKVKLLAPVANPGKIIAAPVNYTRHLQEALADKGIHHGNLVQEIHKAGMFLKATSAVVGPGEGVKLVHTDRRNDHEVELALVIGRTAKNVGAAEALGYVAGFCIGLDMTIRGPEERSLRKSPDSYCVLGPWLVTPDELGDPHHLRLRTWVSDDLRQDSTTDHLIFNCWQMIEHLSTAFTLEPGDVISTGTPGGVGIARTPPALLSHGDIVRIEIEGIGVLENPVIDEPETTRTGLDA